MAGFWKPRLGACYLGDDRCRFRVWASRRKSVELHVTAPKDRVVPMRPLDHDYFEATLDGVPLDKYVVYELHVGTFTPEGTFDAVIPRLPEVDLLPPERGSLEVVQVVAGGQRPGARKGDRAPAVGQPPPRASHRSPTWRTMMEATMRRGQTAGSAGRHTEGPVARGIEEYTAQVPSDVFLWAAGASIIGSLSLMCSGNRHGALFVGQWAPTFLLLGVYNKIVKVAGHDQVS